MVALFLFRFTFSVIFGRSSSYTVNEVKFLHSANIYIFEPKVTKKVKNTEASKMGLRSV